MSCPPTPKMTGEQRKALLSLFGPGAVVASTTHVYDEQGRRIETLSGGEALRFGGRRLYAYDEKGNRIEETRIDPGDESQTKSRA